MKSQIGREFWTERFSAAYMLIWKGDGKTQGQFAKRINEIMVSREPGIKPTCSSQQVSKWLNGHDVAGPKNRSYIIEALNLPEDYFEPSHSDKYHESSEYITEIGKKNVQVAEEIGLDLSLVECLSKLVDFDKCFPIYTPIWKRGNKESQGIEYYRPDSADSAPIDKSLAFMQINRDYKTQTLSKADLCFMKEVQDQVADYVRFLFYQRAERMNEIVETLNEKNVETNELSIEELKEYDKHQLKR